MNRWMLVLECSHRIVSDERQVEGREFCRVCQMSFPIVSCEPYFDAEAV